MAKKSVATLQTGSSGAINAINMVKKSGINLEVDVIDTKNK